jgi:membrane fusion protein (multidrug efflux system)
MDDEQNPSAKTGTGPGTEDKAIKPGKRSFWIRQPVVVAGATLLAVVVYFGLHYIVENFTHESTDDAFLNATVVSVAPRVAGQVRKVWVVDNQYVRAGDPLADLDPRDFEEQVAQKRAGQEAAEANVKLLVASIELFGTQVTTAEASAKQAEAQVAADQALADRAGADLRRAEDLIRKKIISPQEFDAARAAADAAAATLDASREKLAVNRSKTDESRAQVEASRRAWDRAQAQAQQSVVEVDQAKLSHSYAHIAAAQNGWVTRKAVEEGDYVQVGQRLLALVSDDLYVIANFKETQLAQMRTNQPVAIRIDSIGGRVFPGHVQSIQAGSGAAFSLLPPENAVGNYVKVVQRVPVKIVFDPPFDAGRVLGPGMSVEPSVRVSAFELPDLAVVAIAGILAVGAGVVWGRAARRRRARVSDAADVARQPGKD